jgi:hypothetical protein
MQVFVIVRKIMIVNKAITPFNHGLAATINA